MKKIYLAGPDVFLLNAKEHGKILVDTLLKYNFKGLFPIDNEIEFTDNKLENSKRIYNANVKMIHSCDIVLVNLFPFRGPSADVGTVWECAYAKGLGKIVWGYGSSIEYKHKIITDNQNTIIEDFESWDNLMITNSLDGFTSQKSIKYSIKIFEQSIKDLKKFIK